MLETKLFNYDILIEAIDFLKNQSNITKQCKVIFYSNNITNNIGTDMLLATVNIKKGNYENIYQIRIYFYDDMGRNTGSYITLTDSAIKPVADKIREYNLI